MLKLFVRRIERLKSNRSKRAKNVTNFVGEFENEIDCFFHATLQTYMSKSFVRRIAHLKSSRLKRAKNVTNFVGELGKSGELFVLNHYADSSYYYPIVLA